jgi:hypothetical protein
VEIFNFYNNLTIHRLLQHYKINFFYYSLFTIHFEAKSEKNYDNFNKNVPFVTTSYFSTKVDKGKCQINSNTIHSVETFYTVS